MKKVFLSAIVFAFSLLIQAQLYVNDINLNELKDVEFIEIRFFKKTNLALQTKYEYAVFYGQFDGNKQKIYDSERKLIEITTPIHALNIFYLNGWDLENNQYFQYGQYIVESYILRRKK